MDEKKYSQLYQALLQEVLQFHNGNQRRIRKGMLSLLLVPLVFLVLLFLSEGSRVIFLLLWIVSMFGIAAYLIAVEYIDYEMQNKVKRITKKEVELDQLTPLPSAMPQLLPLFQLEARQKQEKDKLKIQMSAKRQEIEKTRRLIRGLYENFVQGILTNDEYFELKADYEYAINALSGEIEVFEKSMDSLDNQLARYRAMEKDAKTLAQDHVLTAELIERLIERIEIDHERNIHVTFRFKNEFQGKAVEPCTTM